MRRSEEERVVDGADLIMKESCVVFRRRVRDTGRRAAALCCAADLLLQERVVADRVVEHPLGNSQ